MTDFLTSLFVGHGAVMGQNALICVIELVVCFCFARHSLGMRAEDPVRHVFIAIALGSFGWAVHRGYWWAWRFFLSIGEAEIAAWFVVRADWLLLFIFCIAGSCLVLLKRWADVYFGRWAWPVSIALSAAVYIVGALPHLIFGGV